MGSETRQDSSDYRTGWRPWWLSDIILLALIVLPSMVLCPFGLISYIAGRRNDCVLLFGGGMFWLMALIPVWVLLVILAVRMFRAWPKHVTSRRRLLWARPTIIVALLLFLAWPFVRIGPPGYSPFMRGFAKRMELNANIGAIQAWLNTVDPNNYRGMLRLHEGKYVDDRGSQIALPESVTCLCPQYGFLLTDDRNHPMIRLAWFAGPFANWGVVIGDEQMPTPASDFSQYGEYRAELCKGAYVWHDIQ